MIPAKAWHLNRLFHYVFSRYSHCILDVRRDNVEGWSLIQHNSFQLDISDSYSHMQWTIVLIRDISPIILIRHLCVISDMLLFLVVSSTRFELTYGSVSSMVAFLIASFSSGLKSIWLQKFLNNFQTRWAIWSRSGPISGLKVISSSLSTTEAISTCILVVIQERMLVYTQRSFILEQNLSFL